MRVSYFCMLSLMVCILVGYSIPISAAVVVTEDQTVANKFVRHTVTGITTPLPVAPDVTGFIGASYVTIADIDKNGVNEIIATSGVGPDSNLTTPNGEVALFTWDGTNMDSWTKTILNNTFAFPNETIARDMDKDGDIDIVVLDQFLMGSRVVGAIGGVYYLENKGGIITNPSNWIKRIIYQDTTPDVYSYHRAYFIDLDGDGDDDVITMVCMYYFALDGGVTSTLKTLWLENNGDGTYSRHTIGSGGGSLFAMFDVDKDGDLDIIAPQFTITIDPLNSYEVLGSPSGSDPLGDSLLWYENPGQAALDANPDLAWSRYTIDNWYTSSNPIGKGFEVVVSDIDNDGDSELVVSNHNHQSSDTSVPPLRIWPSGIFYFEIPENPMVTANWVPVTIETGDPAFVYTSGKPGMRNPYLDPKVLADIYAVDRRSPTTMGSDQGSPGMVRAGDLNNDGYPDLVVPGDGKGRLYYYQAGALSGGNLTFKRATLYSDLQCMPGDAKIVDIDNDGDLDIVAAIFDTSVTKPYPYTSSSIFIFEKQGRCGDDIIQEGEQCEANADCAQYGAGFVCNNCQCEEPQTLIELTGFDAQGAWRRVNLNWTTASEKDNAGFNIYRSETADGEFVKINAALIPAKGSASQGSAYTFIDKGLKNGKTYYYKLEDVDLSGTSTFHGPISVTPALFASVTSGI